MVLQTQVKPQTEATNLYTQIQARSPPLGEHLGLGVEEWTTSSPCSNALVLACWLRAYPKGPGISLGGSGIS